MKTLQAIMVMVLLSITTQVNAQGEQLFKSKCSTCHALDKNMTGPMLQGVRQKWEDAGELELLYEWVKNSTELINSGKSSMAAAIKGYSPTAMAPQQVSNEEIDAILAYVDAWEPKAADPTDPNDPTSAETVTVTDYEGNLDLFYALIILTIFLLIAIIVMSGTVIRLIKSDFFKDKLKKTGKTMNMVLMVGLFLGLGTASSYALEFNGPGEAAEGQPWLLIENTDLYVLLTINIILVGVLFYVRRMFKEFLKLTKEEKAKEAAEEEDVLKKVNQILTDVVPIEEEHTILMDHEYDGIRELDNNLPPWWVWGFYASIAFAVIYLFHYHILGTGDLQIAAYEKDVKQAAKEVAAYNKKMAMNVDETNATMMTEASDIKSGKALFGQHCVLCHESKGQGIEGSGPNLTDNYWIYGNDIKDVFATVKNGRSGGMPEHGTKLNPIQIQQVSSYVLQLEEAQGAAPKGDYYGDEEKTSDDTDAPDSDNADGASDEESSEDTDPSGGVGNGEE